MATEVCSSTYVNDHHDVRALVNYLPLDKMNFGPDDMPAPKKFGEFIESSRYSMSSEQCVACDICCLHWAMNLDMPMLSPDLTIFANGTFV